MNNSTLKKIGRGSFTHAYLNDKGECILHSFDTMKLAVAENLFVPNHRMFPPIELTGEERFIFGRWTKEMKMEYLPRPKSLKNNLTPRQWRLYKALVVVMNSTCYKRACERAGEIYKAFQSMPSEFKGEKEALCDMIEGLRNYASEIGFEISPRNVTVKGGKLILLDCFFDIDLLMSTR